MPIRGGRQATDVHTISSEATSKTFEWVVEVIGPPPHVALRFNVAEPIKAQAVEAVRRRIPEAAAARVEAKTALSGHTVCDVRRLGIRIVANRSRVRITELNGDEVVTASRALGGAVMKLLFFDRHGASARPHRVLA